MRGNLVAQELKPDFIHSLPVDVTRAGIACAGSDVIVRAKVGARVGHLSNYAGGGERAIAGEVRAESADQAGIKRIVESLQRNVLRGSRRNTAKRNAAAKLVASSQRGHKLLVSSTVNAVVEGAHTKQLDASQGEKVASEIIAEGNKNSQRAGKFKSVASILEGARADQSQMSQRKKVAGANNNLQCTAKSISLKIQPINSKIIDFF